MRYSVHGVEFQDARSAMVYARQNPGSFGFPIMRLYTDGSNRIVAFQREDGTVDFRDLPFMLSDDDVRLCRRGVLAVRCWWRLRLVNIALT